MPRLNRSDPAVTSWNFWVTPRAGVRKGPPEGIGITLFARVFRFMIV